MRAQRGAALLTAMLIVTLVATLAAAMVWRQFRAVQIESAERARAQAAWVLGGALDWARLILIEDGKAGGANAETDHLGEVWAVPLAESRLSTFLAADRNNAALDNEGPEAFLSGQIEDAQSRFNLTNLSSKELDPDDVQTLQSLCSAAGLSSAVAERLSSGLREALVSTAETGDGVLLPRRLEQLSWLGLEPESIKRLEPWLILLEQPAPVNLNTAPREVLAAVLRINLGQADRLVQVRNAKPFRNLNDVRAQLPEPQRGAVKDGRVAVNTRHFLVTGRLRLDERVMEQRSLVLRRDGNQVQTLWRERRPVDLGENPRRGSP
ncbi:general secretion pathway protein K [Inhella inkyongensis]|uniref:Type II secretion system protein K n=1 Tax=Inhella inkyongensis TaxID=392593 RepID=A0A840RX44_9BURK|nr:type II secretion system minor pseudopilin GspK [Inhella inkyongensis]MBB5203277.1 general secretion pathway protein K [Inhella inkyongensis]